MRAAVSKKHLCTSLVALAFIAPRLSTGAAPASKDASTQLMMTTHAGDGRGTQKQVLALVDKHGVEMAACYDKKLPFVQPSVQQVDFAFDVRDDGTVGTASVALSTLGRTDVENCFLGVIRGLRFADDFGKAQVKLAYPFVVNWPQGSPSTASPASAEVKIVQRPTLTQAQIKKVLDETADKFRICYDRKVMKQRDFALTTQLRMLIEANGVVSRAEIKPTNNSVRDEDVEACLIDVARRTRFPAVEKGGAVNVTLPFDYHPSARADRAQPASQAPGCHSLHAPSPR